MYLLLFLGCVVFAHLFGWGSLLNMLMLFGGIAAIFFVLYLFGEMTAFAITNPIVVVIILVAISMCILVAYIKSKLKIINNTEIKREKAYSIKLTGREIEDKDAELHIKSFIENKAFLQETENILNHYITIRDAKKELLQRKDKELEEKIYKLEEMRLEYTSKIKQGKAEVDVSALGDLFRAVGFPTSDTVNILQELYPTSKVYYSDIEKYRVVVFMPVCCAIYNDVTRSFKLINYSDLSLKKKTKVEQCNKLESDDELLYYRWQHPRIDGGPDLRYSSNARNAFVNRGEIIITGGGCSVTFKFKNTQQSNAFEKAFLNLTFLNLVKSGERDKHN